MTQPLTPSIQGPPLPGGVEPGDVVWVPAFASEARGGSPFWLRVTGTTPVDVDVQEVTGVRVVPHGTAYEQPEADRIVQVTLPLDRTCRRVFAPTGRP